VLPNVIRTARIILRPFRSSDVDDVLAYASDSAWSRYLISLPASSYTRADAERFVASQASLDWTVRPSWAIEFQDHAVGGVNLQLSHEQQVGEVGYGLAPRLWGHGLAVEAVRAVIDASFRAYPQLIRVRAKTDARNIQSIRVMEKAGMKREGVLRRDRYFRGELVDEVICGLLRCEWIC
jgi:ribosomal-protein-alanine N-acetyltransferase